MQPQAPNHLSISARLLYEEATQRGIECSLFPDDHLLQMSKNGKSWYTAGSRTSLQSSVGKTIADYKHLTKYVMEKNHVPTAPFTVVENMEQIDRVNQLRFPVVGKPTVGNQGKGVVVGIQNFEEARAYAQDQFTNYLKRELEYVLFEELLVGEEYRILCIDYKFVAAAYRKPAHVVGNGTNTIQELIDQKNLHPWRGTGHESPLTMIIVDELVLRFLSEQSLNLENIPAHGQEVLLRKTANLSTGGEAWNVTDQVVPENRTLFEQIAKACDLNTTGIDVKCTSLSVPLQAQQRAGIVEVNTSPGLRMHHFPIQGEPVNAAGKILDMVMNHL